MYETEVKKGSEWLDRVHPGWYKKIDLEKFRLANYESCALGQTFGKLVCENLCEDFAFSGPHGFRLLFPKTVVIDKKWYGKEHRTNVPVSQDQYERAYRKLTGTWIQEILRRRMVDRMTKKATSKSMKSIAKIQ